FSSSLSEKAIACTRKSSRPQRSPSASNTRETLDSLVTSQSRTKVLPTVSANGRTRFSSASPWNVNASSAPCALTALEMPHARERSLATPMIRPRLPSMIGRACVMVRQLLEVPYQYQEARRILHESSKRGYEARNRVPARLPGRDRQRRDRELFSAADAWCVARARAPTAHRSAQASGIRHDPARSRPRPRNPE